jgi:5-methylthioadenosine/S-adenosylhomocysteine deaminase
MIKNGGSMRTLIKAKYIIGYENNDHVVYIDGEVVYEEDTILFVGHSFPEDVDKVIDAGDSIVSPGFIDLNALGDIDHDLIHQEVHASKKYTRLWSEDYCLRGSREVMAPEEEAFKSLYAYTQLIRNGITTAMSITSVLYKKWAETYEELAAAVDHAGHLGLRIYLGPSYMCGVDAVKRNGQRFVYWDEKEGAAGLQRAVDFIRNFDGAYDGLVRGMLAPERIETQTPEILLETRRWSDELDCPIKLHAAQGKFEYDEIQHAHQKSPIQYLYALGFLGHLVSIPHGVFLNGYGDLEEGGGDDLALLIETQTNIIHCPVVFARHCMAMVSFGKYFSAGARLAIGTDTFPPDILQNIRIGSYIARVMDHSVENNTFADFFRAATLGGADALGRDDLGRLAIGAKADMIIIDISDFHFGPMDDPIRTMMITASGADVKTSIINGRVVMRDRKIEGIDLSEIQKKGQQYYEKMRLGYLERDYLNSSEEEFFSPSFKMIEKK